MFNSLDSTLYNEVGKLHLFYYFVNKWIEHNKHFSVISIQATQHLQDVGTDNVDIWW